MVALLDFMRTTWLLALIRYTLIASPAMYLVLAALGTNLKPLLRYPLPALAAFSCLVALPTYYKVGKTDFRSLGHELAARAKPGETTVFWSLPDPEHVPYMYLACVSHYAGAMPGPVVLLTHPADPALLAQLRSRGRVWIVGTNDEIQNLLPGAEVQSQRTFVDCGCLLSVRWPSAPTTAPMTAPPAPLKAPSR